MNENGEGRASARPGTGDMRTRGSASLPVADNAGERTRGSASLPVRKRPSKNSVRIWGGDTRPVILFVTVCTEGRAAILDNADAVEIILKAFAEADLWVVGRYMIMPDHIHFFCSPRTMPPCDFQRWIKYWKACVTRLWHQGGPRFRAAEGSAVADAQKRVPPGFPVADAQKRVPPGSPVADAQKRVPPVFQRECWDVQMRNAAQYAEKMNYVVGNPVRKGLVDDWHKWPYQGELTHLEWHG